LHDEEKGLGFDSGTHGIDYKFAVATLILFTFFLFAGIASWLTSDKPTAAAEPSTVIRFGAQ
jgi:hypothetical protein